MDNISDLLGSVLSDPNAVAKLRETARQLGLGGDQLGLNGQTDESVETSPQHHAAAPKTENSDDLGAGMIAALGKLTPLIGKLGEEDDMTRLLHALRPYLTGTRLKRAEEADKIVAIMRVIPLLKQQQQQT